MLHWLKLIRLIMPAINPHSIPIGSAKFIPIPDTILGAIANAVTRATGVRMTDLPLTPPKILAAIDAKK